MRARARGRTIRNAKTGAARTHRCIDDWFSYLVGLHSVLRFVLVRRVQHFSEFGRLHRFSKHFWRVDRVDVGNLGTKQDANLESIRNSPA